ncbi:MAG: hypothetical protein L0G87_15780, partial [Renibacterium salmoninarum]|nr:hypothetical protein [Renibacterium salmoninarum]
AVSALAPAMPTTVSTVPATVSALTTAVSAMPALIAALAAQVLHQPLEYSLLFIAGHTYSLIDRTLRLSGPAERILWFTAYQINIGQLFSTVTAKVHLDAMDSALHGRNTH